MKTLEVMIVFALSGLIIGISGAIYAFVKERKEATELRAEVTQLRERLENLEALLLELEPTPMRPAKAGSDEPRVPGQGVV